MNVRADLVKNSRTKVAGRHVAGQGDTDVMRGGAYRFKHFSRKVINVLSFNADAVFKSKEWPYY